MTDQTPAPEDLATACARLQGELDAMLGKRDADEAVGSLDHAVASLKGVEQRNVSSVQLVALD
ncbi:hypothetical protein ACQPW1_20545 [Nocardia sp. CA-128927]|uniref:hypothetical protein n=1 Tax=Nocardia sp. CA-128927 TaxID=3239975 RepID=UPI003D961643